MAVTGVQRYRALVGISGARAPLILSTAGSMPIGMFGLAILLLAHEATGSFAQAGRVVGAFGLANALGAVAQGRVMDRLGQTRVLRAAACGHLPALIALVAAADAGASTWVLSLLALCGGATVPQLPAAMRSLWNALVADPEQRAAAYALVAVVFEVAVVTAPVLVAGIVAVASPQVAVIAAAVIGAGSAIGFTTTAASRAWRGERHEAGWPGTPPIRLSALMLGLGATIALLAVAGTDAGLAALLVGCGLLLAPTTVVGSTLLDTVAPAGTVTEAFAAMVMGIVLGTAIGNALGGALVEASSYATAVLLGGAIAAAGSALALLRRRTLGPLG